MIYWGKATEFKKNVIKWLKKPEYVYLLVASIAVISFILITPPFQGPDEEVHYNRVQYIAHGFLIPSKDAVLSDSIAKVTKTTFYDDDLRGKTTDHYELFRTKAALKIPYEGNNNYKPVMVTYNPILYAPAVPGVFFANVFNASPLLSMYIARLSLAVASIVIMFFAIKFLPQKKYLLLAVGLLPMMLFQQAMITADSISYALLALFIAYVLYLREQKVVARKQWIVVGLLCVGIVLAKPLVFIFLPLVLMLFKNRRDMIWILSIAGICLVALVSSMTINNEHKDATPNLNAPSTVSAQDQTDLLLHDPVRGLRVGWNSYMTNYGDDEARGVIGTFGAADTLYPLWMGGLYLIVVGILAIVGVDQVKATKIEKRWKVVVIILATAYFAAVNAALYIGYTPVDFDIVYGVQGRYFLPAVIALAMLVFTTGLKISKTDIKSVKFWSLVMISTLVFLAIFITYQRYYLYTP